MSTVQSNTSRTLADRLGDRQPAQGSSRSAGTIAKRARVTKAESSSKGNSNKISEQAGNRKRHVSDQKKFKKAVCPLCSECLFGISDIILCDCGHVFCSPCIYAWLEDNNECPQCENGDLIARMERVYIPNRYGTY